MEILGVLRISCNLAYLSTVILEMHDLFSLNLGERTSFLFSSVVGKKDYDFHIICHLHANDKQTKKKIFRFDHLFSSLPEL